MPLRPLCSLIVACLALSTASRAQDVVKIGMIAPLTGVQAAFGQEFKAGAQAAVEKIKDINGRKIELIFRDDECKADKAVASFNELANREKPVAVLGLPCSGSALAVLELARKYQILTLPVAGAPDLTRREVKEILRPFGRADRLARMTADVLKNRFEGKKIAWLGSERSPFSMFFKADAERHKLNITPLLSDEPVTPRMLDIVSGQDVVVVTRFLDARSLVDLGEKTGGSTTIVLVQETVRPSDVAPLRSARNVVVISNPEPNSPDLMKESAAAGYFPYGYASVEIVATLASRTKTLDPYKLLEEARKADIPTMLGSLRFDGAGDVQDWRFGLWQRTGSTNAPIAMIDVCKSPNCKDYSHCPPNCPNQ